MYKSLKVDIQCNLDIEIIVLHLKKSFPTANHINKKGVVSCAINRYKQFLIEESQKKETKSKDE
jgi:hydrogenase maturation factor HypF (carbamoyltransferase family)